LSHNAAPRELNEVTSNYIRGVDATIQARIRRDPAYTQALWNEAVQLFLEGEPQTTKIILRDLGNAAQVSGASFRYQIDSCLRSVYAG
jgi:hypothetical protein